MKLRIVTGFLAVIVIALCVGCSSKAKPSESSYDKLLEDNRKLKEQLNEAPGGQKERERLAEKIEKLQIENEKLTKKVEKLQADKEKLQEKIKAFQASSKGNSKPNWKTGKKLSDEEIVELLFWEADKPYEMRDPEFNFYFDPSCKKEFIISKDLTFVNSFDYEIVDPVTKEKAYISMSNEKGGVFSRQRPYFHQME